MRNLIVAITFMLTFSALFATPSFAADCKPIYGGGTTTDTVCDGKRVAGQKTANTPTTKPQGKATPTPAKSGNTTKGGLPVLTPAPQKTTPSTGPEVLGLITLAPAAAIGFYLRKKK